MAVVADAPVSFPAADATLRAHVARPVDAPPLAGLVLIPDVRGVSDHYRDVGRRFAAEGFHTLVLDPYSREGAPDLPDMAAVFRWLRALPDRRVLGDVATAVDWTAQQTGKPVGITGFCMGGQYALMAACTVPRITACVSWYGMLRYAETDDVKPADGLTLAPRLGFPYLGLFGADDQLIPQADVAALEAILAREGKTFEIHVYPDAAHAFFNDARPDAYRPEAARDAFPRAVAFLRRHLADTA
jgi:carboxymethylenebutenolidase